MGLGEATARTGGRRVLGLLACGSLAASAILTLTAARGSLWFDEVWSMGLAVQSQSAWDVLARRFDNNHVLNTVYLWALGPNRASDVTYRLLSVGSGLASLGLLGWIASRRRAAEGVLVLLLAGSSYPLVLYWSEARGYAPAMCCAVLAFALLRSTWTRLGPGRVVAFWAVLALGVLAHLTFVIPLFASMVAAAVHEVRRFAPWWRRVGRLVVLFAVPLAFHAWFYVVFVRDLRVVGGPVEAYRDVAATAAAMLLGMPNDGGWRLAAVVVCLVVVCAGSAVAWRRRPEEGAFYAAVLLVGPFGLLAATRPEHLYYRYFIVSFPFFHLALAELLGAIARDDLRRWGAVGVLVVGPWMAGHGRRLEPLLRYGRGNDRGALRYASAHSASGAVRVGCDSETGVLLSFYARDLPSGQTLELLDPSRWGAERPEWVMTRSLGRSYWPPPELELPGGLRYRRVEAFRHGGGSGWTSFLWRRDDDAAASATRARWG